MSAWSAWRAQPRRRRRLAVEAGLALSRAKLALALRPFAAAVTSSCRPLGNKDDAASPEELAHIVDAVGRRLWWRSVCFDRGLALQAMCRRRGIDAKLHYGIGNDGGGALAGHVWVTAGGAIIIGGAEAANFRCVAIYPAAGAR